MQSYLSEEKADFSSHYKQKMFGSEWKSRDIRLLHCKQGVLSTQLQIDVNSGNWELMMPRDPYLYVIMQ